MNKKFINASLKEIMNGIKVTVCFYVFLPVNDLDYSLIQIIAK